MNAKEKIQTTKYQEAMMVSDFIDIPDEVIDGFSSFLNYQEKIHFFHVRNKIKDRIQEGQSYLLSDNEKIIIYIVCEYASFFSLINEAKKYLL